MDGVVGGVDWVWVGVCGVGNGVCCCCFVASFPSSPWLMMDFSPSSSSG